MGNTSSAEEPQLDADIGTPGMTLRQNTTGTYRRRSSTSVLHLSDLAGHRGYSRVVHGNGGAAFLSAMHGF